MYFSIIITVFIALRLAVIFINRKRRNVPSIMKHVPLLYTILSGICGSVSFTFAKCAVQLVKTSLFEENQMTHFETYVIIAVFVVSAIMQVHLLNLAMKIGEILMVIPAFFVLNTILSVISGLVYFQEYSSFNVGQSIVSCLCILS